MLEILLKNRIFWNATPVSVIFSISNRQEVVKKDNDFSCFAWKIT